jgi:hypothetical protein
VRALLKVAFLVSVALLLTVPIPDNLAWQIRVGVSILIVVGYLGTFGSPSPRRYQ